MFRGTAIYLSLLSLSRVIFMLNELGNISLFSLPVTSLLIFFVLSRSHNGKFSNKIYDGKFHNRTPLEKQDKERERERENVVGV